MKIVVRLQKCHFFFNKTYFMNFICVRELSEHTLLQIRWQSICLFSYFSNQYLTENTALKIFHFLGQLGMILIYLVTVLAGK